METNNKTKLNDEDILVCACHSVEHQIVIQKDNEDKTLYCSIHLIPLPWYQRIANGIRYIFGYKCKYGDFDEFAFSKKHIDKLEQMINFLKDESKL